MEIYCVKGRARSRDCAVGLVCRKTDVPTVGSWVTGRMNALDDRAQVKVLELEEMSDRRRQGLEPLSRSLG